MQPTVRQEIREVLESFERAGRDVEPEAVTRAYADNFLSLDASSAHVLTPRALISVLPRRKALFESIGADGMELGHIAETPLDDNHTLVRTSWTLRTRPDSPRKAITLHSTFLLRLERGAWRIVVYLNHQDMRKLFSNPDEQHGKTR
jgi:ketosteroid isomerase-like protein